MDLRCKYTNKPCANPRAQRPDGTLLRLCNYHRGRANEAQRRWLARHHNKDEKPCGVGHDEPRLEQQEQHQQQDAAWMRSLPKDLQFILSPVSD